jgi:CubicO group peptidase (beta-lactamase class C family)
MIAIPPAPAMFMRRLLLLTMALSLSMGALVHAADDFLLSRFSAYLEALRTQAGIPGLAAAIVGPTAVNWEGAFGQRDVERNLPALLDTPFQLDDTTQTIVATLALRCASDGLLSLDDPVGKFAPLSPDAGATIRQLLTHTTAGATGLTFSYRPERLAPVAAAIASCTDSTFRWGMSDRFGLMGMIVDSVPGSDVVRLTAPAEGFTASLLQRYSDVLSRLATPYAVDARGRATPSSYVASTLTPASGLISSVRDLEQFDLSLKNGKLLRRDWLALAWAPPIDASGQSLPHAFGWFVQSYNGEPIVWQFGVSDNASSSMLITAPRRGVTLILLANSPGLARPFALSSGDVTVSPFARLFLSIFVR